MRTCYKCKQSKPFSEFFRNKTKAKGFSHICKSCKQIDRKKYDDKYRTKRLLNLYKKHDNKKGLEYNITISWFNENIMNKPCVYCNDSENIGCDRLDNTKGHTIDNCIPCCALCNITRMDNYSFSEMQLLGKIISQIKRARISLSSPL